MSTMRERIATWLDEYFEAANRLQGNVDSVGHLSKYFAPDMQFWMYTPPPFITPPLSREELLMTFVHPGIHERLNPVYYVIDVDSMLAVVHFELQFRHSESGKTWPPLLASAHYHLGEDAKGEIVINKIQYWTQSHQPGDDFDSLFGLWNSAKEQSLVEFGMKYFRAESAAGEA
jgi:hypothetical protein